MRRIILAVALAALPVFVYGQTDPIVSGEMFMFPLD